MTISNSIGLFFLEHIEARGITQVLPEESSRHIIQVLRMRVGDPLQLTDGRGKTALAMITDDHKKRCEVRIDEIREMPPPDQQHTIAIALLKNNTRFEWFLEKAAELGISRIVPLLTARTEKSHLRFDRMKTILVSAMLQSQQAWLTDLSAPVSFEKWLNNAGEGGRFIAHCEPGEKGSLLDADIVTLASKLVLIGPEGDFTPEEIQQAVDKGFRPVTLGDTRLRTETAGIVAATLLQQRG
jgi:16S rRNA (uracil1498-N3)-methyltransferase